MNLIQGLKNWLRDSGIIYSTIYDDALFTVYSPYNGLQIPDQINPFSAIVEDERYPMARIYRSEFKRRFRDTFRVLYGRHYDWDLTGYGRKGLLDYLTLYPLFARKCIGYFCEYNNNINNRTGFIAIPAVIIGGILEVARYIQAAALTISLTPVIAICDIFAKLKSSELRSEAENLMVHEENSRSKPLKYYLAKHDRSLDDVNVSNKPNESLNILCLYKLYIDKDNSEKSIEACEQLNLGGNLKTEPEFRVKF